MLSSPKPILLEPVVWVPPGLPALKASSPIAILLPPVVTLYPAAFPIAVLDDPVQRPRAKVPTATAFPLVVKFSKA